jgi:hypothetical protein
MCDLLTPPPSSDTLEEREVTKTKEVKGMRCLDMTTTPTVKPHPSTLYYLSSIAITPFTPIIHDTQHLDDHVLVVLSVRNHDPNRRHVIRAVILLNDGGRRRRRRKEGRQREKKKKTKKMNNKMRKNQLRSLVSVATATKRKRRPRRQTTTTTKRKSK